MCCTRVAYPRCSYCYETVKDVEPEVKVKRCGRAVKCLLPSSLREQAIEADCANCSWKKARELLASRTALNERLSIISVFPIEPAECSGRSTFGTPLCTIDQLPDERSREQRQRIHNKIEDATVEEHGKMLLGSELIKES